MENIWLVSIAALVVGAIIGFLMGRAGGDNNRQAELAEQLNDARTELEGYKQDVSRHFEETADLVNNLTNSYKDVHHHLAKGAQNLCQSETMAKNLETMMQPKLEETSTEEAPEESAAAPASGEEPSATAEPPRDYAPKNPDEEGTLSENFGVKEETAEAQQEEASETPNADNPEPAEPQTQKA